MAESLKLAEELSQVLQAAQIQLRVHRNMLVNWNYVVLAEAYSSGERNIGLWLDSLIRHALTRECVIDVTPAQKQKIGQTVEEMLVSDRAVAALASRVWHSADQSHVSAGETLHTVRSVVYGLRGWQHFLENQQEMIRQMGMPAYLMVIARPSYQGPGIA
jgi:bacterioferritin (cytochrome b1)